MNIDNLATFIEIAKNKSFSRAAESLQLTQPAVSKRVVALETALSAKLLDRNGRNVHLTEAGQVLLPSARQITNEWSRIEQAIDNLGDGVSGPLCIGTSEHTSTHLIPGILETFRKRYPKVTFELKFGNSYETLQALENGTLELALSSLPERKLYKQTAKLNQTPIRSDNLVFVASYDHPLTAQSTIGLKDLANYPAILPSELSLSRSLIDNAFKQKGLTLPVSTEASDFETIRSMASIGIGWACLPKFLLDDTLILLEVDEIDLKQVVSLIRMTERTLSNPAQAFLDLLDEHYPAAPSPEQRVQPSKAL